MNRRSFIKVGGAAVGALLVSVGMQNATMRSISAEYVPGAGHPEPKEGETTDPEYNERVKNIDTDKFLAGCARCGVCLQKCPFQAIKSRSIAVPQLTDATRAKCPGYENCGICATVCPTDCLNDAFSNYDKGTAVDEKPPWWEGPYEKKERKPSI